MTLISADQANSKTTEFARLFDLLDRIATRRTQAVTGDTSEVISTDDIASIPAEFASVLKNLSTTLSLRVVRDEERARHAQTTLSPVAHSNLGDMPATTATTQNRISHAEEVESLKDVEDQESPAFPLGERYPFTFKLMLHELYDLDEWAEKVRSAVEMSKSQFKPLAEHTWNAVDPDVEANAKEVDKRNSIPPVLGALAKVKPPSTPRLHPTMGSKPDTSRVVKKRCVGRRKSINGPISSGVWVYNAAVSATEVTGPRPAVEITLSTPGDTRSEVERRARHHSMTAFEVTQAQLAARHNVKIAAPLPQGEAPETIRKKPAQEVTETKSVEKRKKSTITALASPSRQTTAVKRPLCG